MNMYVEMIRRGGTLMYVISTLHVLSLLTTLILAGMTWKRKHVPWLLWSIIPLLILIVGTLAQITAVPDMFAILSKANPMLRMKIVAAWIANLQNIKFFAAFGLTFLPLFSAFMLSVTTLVSTPKPHQWTWLTALLGVISPMLAVGAVIFARFSLLPNSSISAAPMLIATYSVPMLLAHIALPRDKNSPDMARVTASRLGVTVLLLLSLLGCAQLHFYMSMNDTYNAMEKTEPAMLINMVQRGLEFSNTEFEHVMYGFVALLVSGVITSALTIKHAIKERRVRVHAAISAAVMTIVLIIQLASPSYIEDSFKDHPFPDALLTLHQHTNTPTTAPLSMKVPMVSHDWRPMRGGSSDGTGCTLHYQQNQDSWQVISNVSSAYRGHLDSCFKNADLSCELKPGPVKQGELCTPQDSEIHVVIQGDMKFSKLATYTWNTTHPISFLINLSTQPEGHILEVPSIFRQLVVRPFEGVLLRWNTTTQKLDAYDWILLDQQKDGGFLLVNVNKPGQEIPTDSIDGAHHKKHSINTPIELIHTLQELHQSAGLDISRLGLLSSPDATVQEVMNSCILLDMAAKNIRYVPADDPNSTLPCQIINPILRNKVLTLIKN